MTSARPSRATRPNKRDHLLDCVERMMIDDGYAAVTYRALATRAGVTPALVQHYFPSLDNLFISAVQRRAEQSLVRLERLLKDADQPLRILWQFSREEASAALMTEFLALGNHRKSIGAVIAQVTEDVRRVQFLAVEAVLAEHGPPPGDVSPAVALFLLTAIPKILTLEAGVGVSLAHAEVVAAFEDYIDRVEPLNLTTP